MSTNIESKIGSTVYARLNAVKMSESERQRAFYAVSEAQRFVDAIVWMARKIERLSERLFLKPSLKH
jgi:hypothetical protein